MCVCPCALCRDIRVIICVHLHVCVFMWVCECVQSVRVRVFVHVCVLLVKKDSRSSNPSPKQLLKKRSSGFVVDLSTAAINTL